MPTGRAAPPRLSPPTAAERRRVLRCRQGGCRRCAASLVARIRNACVPGCVGRHVSRLGRLTLRGMDPAARHVHHRRAICSSRLAPTAAAARGGSVCGCERCVPSVERPQVSGSSAAAGRFRGAGRGQRQVSDRRFMRLVGARPAPSGSGACRSSWIGGLSEDGDAAVVVVVAGGSDSSPMPRDPADVRLRAHLPGDDRAERERWHRY